MRNPSRLRKSAGLVMAFLLAMSWFSPMQVTLRTLPDTLALTMGQVSQLQLGGLTLSGDALTVTATQDETLASVGAVDVSAAQSGQAQMVLSLFGIPLKRVEVEVSPEKRLIPGGMALGVAMRTEGVLVVGIICFALSYVALSAAQDMGGLLVAAVIGSAGFGSCAPLVQTLALSSVPVERRGAASNTAFTGLDLGMLIGPPTGGLVTEALFSMTGSMADAYSAMWIVMLVPAACALALVIYWNVRAHRR